MPASPAERARAYRDRLRGRPVTLAPCGTRAAAVRHRRTGEALCPPCVEAEREYQREMARPKKPRETS